LRQAKGESHPRIVLIEHEPPNPVDGVSWALVLMKADSAFHLLCGPVPDHGSRICRPHYAVVPVALDVGNNVATPGDVAGKFGLTGTQVTAIARARRARPQLERFPTIPGWPLDCVIPLRNGRTTSGYCRTDANPPRHVRYVDFTESWKLRDHWQEDHWIVTFTREGRVRSVGHQPHFTPQEVHRLLR
jgi:hypothetical protein